MVMQSSTIITPLQIDENTEAELVEIQNTIIDNGGKLCKDCIISHQMAKAESFTFDRSSVNRANNTNRTNNTYRNKFSIYIYKWRISAFTKRC